MTADIRAAAEAEAERIWPIRQAYTVNQQKSVFSVREVDAYCASAFQRGAEWGSALVTPTRESIALAILMVTQGDVSPEYAWSVQYPEMQHELLAQAEAVLALMVGLATVREL